MATPEINPDPRSNGITIKIGGVELTNVKEIEITPALYEEELEEPKKEKETK